MKTYFAKEPSNDWVVIDAAGMTVGRLATRIAHVLRGKHKPTYAPHQAGGDFVVVVNASKVTFTGSKLDQKLYTRYSGFPGGLKQIPAGDMLAKHPERVIERAVWGMLPKNRLGRKLIRRLKVYAAEAHPHAAQQPRVMEVG